MSPAPRGPAAPPVRSRHLNAPCPDLRPITLQNPVSVPAARRLSGVTDNSLYPVMFMSYLDVLVPGLKAHWTRT